MEHFETEDVRDWIDDDLSDPIEASYFPLGAQVTRKIWQEADLDAVVPDPLPANAQDMLMVYRRAAHRLNVTFRKLDPPPDPIRPGHLIAMALLTEILRYVFDLYTRRQQPGVVDKAMQFVNERKSPGRMQTVQSTFVDLFAPFPVLRGQLDPEDYLNGELDGLPNSHRICREAMLLSISISNPALKSYRILFDDAELERRVRYSEVVELLDGYLEEQPGVEPLDLSLPACLRAPIYASPDSIEGQLDYIRTHWRRILPPRLLQRLNTARDALREETMIRDFPGKGHAEVLRFGLMGDYPEFERFTADSDWMAKVVLIAKVAYVWLDQLSKQYGRSITRLDEIPDEELDRLARWGFTGLWLIGVWERSSVSQEIKRRMGNPEAAASAYSLYDYQIAHDLGDEAALYNLKERAWKRGIRLASDMVPNHVGIYSRWVVEHPDWFIQAPHSPFPGYSFNGPDLSPDERVGLFIEDGYWNHSDAAVVFKRVDRWTGDTRYIYHGNDGTHMPWNDTAQLNYLIAEVREAVIQTILHVARMFPIIRFDAAMTLAKKHYQRLWFPLPGEGGAIPSRSQYAMTREQFDAAFPEEFWRQVVDRVQEEVPETLLLAEAFWLMEGYFVRTLGMHRVYNSAFMNMLKLEDNLNYRTTIKNVLEFSPEVAKRFVNFMNNPDEMTAVEQFGKGDKYFGAAMMMVTMPGLPMFGHGQIEGFTEKYGMEYRRAYWDEAVDEELVRRHEREIFPLVQRRYLFSGVEYFAFYDFIHPDDYVNENVFAYSNRAGDERCLVIYNNAYEATQGHVHTSTAINIGTGDAKQLVRRTLSESLGFRSDSDVYYVFRDNRTGLQYIREGADLNRHGIHIHLNGYQYYVFLDFHEVLDVYHIWGQVAARLEGGGSPDIKRLYREIMVAPLLEAFRLVAGPKMLTELSEACQPRKSGSRVRKHLDKALVAFLDVAAVEFSLDFPHDTIREAIERDIDIISNIKKRLDEGKTKGGLYPKLCNLVAPATPNQGPLFWRIPLVWALVRHLEEVLSLHAIEDSKCWLEDWLLTVPIAESFAALGLTQYEAQNDTRLIMVLISHTPVILTVREDEPAYLFEEMLDDGLTREYLGYNQYKGVHWIGKERLEQALGWMVWTAAVATLCDEDLTPEQQTSIVASRLACAQRIIDEAAKAGYQVERMLERLSSTEEEPEPKLESEPKPKGDSTKTKAKKMTARPKKPKS